MEIMENKTLPNRILSFVSCLLTTTALALPAQAQPQSAPPGAERGIGNVQLGRNLRGPEIPTVLGGSIAEIATAYGKSEAEIRSRVESIQDNTHLHQGY